MTIFHDCCAAESAGNEKKKERGEETGVITLLRARTIASHGSLLQSRGRNLPEFYRSLLIMRAALITRQSRSETSRRL